MNKVKCALVCASLGSVFAAAPNAAASEPMTHDGFYMSLQAGFGYLSSTAEAGGAELTLPVLPGARLSNSAARLVPW